MPSVHRSRPWDYGRPIEPFALNADSRQAQGLVGWWPLTIKSYRTRDGAKLNHLTAQGSGLVYHPDKPMGSTLYFGSSSYLEVTSAVLSAPPITLACWFWPNDVTSNYALLGMSQSSGSDRQILVLNGTTTDSVGAFTGTSATSGQGESSAAYVANAWQHGAGVFESTTSRAGYLNGANKGTNSTSVNPTGLNRTILGARYNVAIVGLFLNGRLGDARIYNRVLSDGEIAELYAEETRWQLYYPIGRKSWIFLGRSVPPPTPTTVPVRLAHLRQQEIA